MHAGCVGGVQGKHAVKHRIHIYRRIQTLGGFCALPHLYRNALLRGKGNRRWAPFDNRAAGGYELAEGVAARRMLALHVAARGHAGASPSPTSCAGQSTALLARTHLPMHLPKSKCTHLPIAIQERSAQGPLRAG